MKCLRWLCVSLGIVLLIGGGDPAKAYDPAERETIARISGASDAFVHGVVTGIRYTETNGRPVTITTLEIEDTYFSIGEAANVESEVAVVTPGGRVTNEDGEEVSVRALNSPNLVEGRAYLAYLRWNESLQAFTFVLF